MDATIFIKAWSARGWSILGCSLVLLGTARAQVAAPTPPASSWLGYDWLKPAEDQKRQAASGETFTATVGQDVKDPFTVLSSGTLWQDKYGALYSRQLGDGLTLSCQNNTVTADNDPEALSQAQLVDLEFQPIQQLTLRANVSDSTNDSMIPSAATTSTGAGFAVESHLPNNAVLMMGLQSNRTDTDTLTYNTTQTNAYDAQFQQPLGQLPVTAVLKGHFEGTSDGGGPATSLPSLEQSFIWKPVQDTIFQAGLRQQQYQEYPGVDHELNEALFADVSQKVVDNVSWHSYAEVLNSRGLLDQAPASSISSGANGTPQATTPGSNASVTSSLPISIDDQTLTFSTGPSFQLQKDISASVEYSNRWDKNPAPGSIGQEQRVSISLKGTF
jgi:hypothetical protein